MYISFYRLTELPFQITPDSRFFYGQGPHKKALAYATYGLNKAEGFVVITGEIGAGKTTLMNYLLGRLKGRERKTANLVSTKLEADNLLRMVASAFGIDAQADDKANLLRKIEAFLADGERTGAPGLLIVDEVQNLSFSSLEELRMLSNFQRNHNSLLQTFLIGQPEFRTVLQQPNMEQLRQRVVASFHLSAMDEQQTREYIEHRLRLVGWDDDPHFHPLAFSEIHRASSGVPRRINLICDRLMVSGFLAERHSIDLTDVNEVISEIRQERLLSDPDVLIGVDRDLTRPSPVAASLVAESVDDALESKKMADISVRLRHLDLQMREQERRLDQILADGLFAVSKQ